MFDEKGMLTDRARGILFWFTIAMILTVAILAILFIFNRCSRLLSQPVEVSLSVAPAEKELCVGQQHQFTFTGDDQVVTWAVTEGGGTITQSGLYTAETAAGDYTVTVTGRDSKKTATAVVRVKACTPTATPVSTVAATATPVPEPTVAFVPDAQGDVVDYNTGAPVEGAPTGLDIQAASVAEGLRVTLQPGGVAPDELAGWAAEGEALMWIQLFEPVPEGSRIRWFIVLDVDGNGDTGRSPGTLDINTDLGDEIAVMIEHGTGQVTAWVWDNASGFVDGPAGARYTVTESRTVVGFALPLDAFAQAVSERAGVTVVPEAVKGRVAADAFIGEQRVIDYYPNP
jgi:hypothetical protein